MKTYEIRSIEKSCRVNYVINYTASEYGHSWYSSTEYYFYSKRDALRKAHIDMNIKRNPCKIRDYTITPRRPLSEVLHDYALLHPELSTPCE